MNFRFYDHPAGVKAPSVTSILGLLGEERLYNWRLRYALKFIQENKIDMSDKQSLDMVFDEVCDLATVEADMGKWIHAYAELHFSNKSTDILYERSELKKVISDLENDVLDKRDTLEILEQNFQHFIRSLGPFEIMAVEEEIHGVMDGPFDDPMYFSGRIDTIIRQQKRTTLLDFKTSRQAYDNHAAQVVAYGYAWNAHQKRIGETNTVNNLWVVRLGRTKRGRPFEIIKISGHNAQLALAMFRNGLEQWYIRSGQWGNILPEQEDEGL